MDWEADTRRPDKSITELLFSGGRDSTIAAVRLSGRQLLLVTLTHDGLVGIESVHRRLEELGPILRPGSSWSLIRWLPSDAQAHVELPRHLGFSALCAVVGVLMARTTGICEVAFGYTDYQKHWTEQAPEAIAALRSLYAEHGLTVLLPVTDVSSKDLAVRELQDRQLCPDALEQKGVFRNANLGQVELLAEVNHWRSSTVLLLAQMQVDALDVVERRKLKEDHKWYPDR